MIFLVSFLKLIEFHQLKMLVFFLIIIMQGACVQNVLDSLIPALLADKNRKFIYVEQVKLSTFLLYVCVCQVSLGMHVDIIACDTGIFSAVVGRSEWRNAKHSQNSCQLGSTRDDVLYNITLITFRILWTIMKN